VNPCACLQVWLVGEAGTTLLPTNAAQLYLLALLDGTPPVQISNARLIGRLRVEGGELRLIDCSVEPVMYNSGARELAEELNAILPGLLQVAQIDSWDD
jgi:hypothetical protein